MQKPYIYAFADEASAMIDGQISAMKKNGLDGLEIRNVDGRNISDITIEKPKKSAISSTIRGLSSGRSGLLSEKSGLIGPNFRLTLTSLSTLWSLATS